ncbi:polysaccharide biosynthesis protein, partial [Alphaproteobacteria bacterium]|nr:polysaccharide biosynthesis protein [Alphaproteobacteria bacterium]
MNDFLNKLIKLPKLSKKIILLLADASIILFGTFLVFYIYYGADLYFYKSSLTYIVFSILVACISFNFFGLYKTILRYSGVIDIENAFKSMIIFFCIMATSVSMHKTEIDINFVINQSIAVFLLFTLYRRLIYKILYSYRINKIDYSLDHILIYGAGQAGRQLLAILKENEKKVVVGFIDDDVNLQSRIQNNINIYHPQEIKKLMNFYTNLKIIIAMPSISQIIKNKIVNTLLDHNIPISTLPSIDTIVTGNAKPTDIIKMKIEDLLGRDQIQPNQKMLSKNITNKNVLITGAGGSIGSELCRQIIRLKPKKMLLIENSEFALFKIYNELINKQITLNFKTKLIPIMCDINDKPAILAIMEEYKPFSVFHAAAYKHVHLVEMNNLAGIKNNILGTLNLIKSCIQYDIKNFIFISTDKAVRPTNLMGASKRFAEIILQSLAKNNNNIKISIVRFGNVLGSSGSVIPIFREQIEKGGPVTVSHRNVKRYFMTIPEATELVIQASSISQKNGNIFYLEMGVPIKIYDLARKMINLSGYQIFSKKENNDKSIKIAFTGLKPGEKMYEELVIDGKSEITENPRIYSVEEHFVEWKSLKKIISLIENNIEKSNIDGI